MCTKENPCKNNSQRFWSGLKDLVGTNVYVGTYTNVYVGNILVKDFCENNSEINENSIHVSVESWILLFVEGCNFAACAACNFVSC